MESRSTWHETAVGRVEVGTITYEGREFSCGGARVTPTYAGGYPKFEREYVGATGEMQGWDGTVLGTCRIIGKRPGVWFGRESWQGSTWYYIRATIDGVTYSGAGFGSGMLWRGRVVKGGRNG